ncbi:lipase 3-like [Hyposmocoma kahamanoa]|uniref:lipase 3-like n=1 Tax=Hyposmocoma kahamanoa TaxID=1477025 RepID=UPI000E6DA270|nr:lipase 3-like [Hyposmocoma kahamanoa]
MDLRISIFIHTIFIFLSINSAHNKRREIKTAENNDLSASIFFDSKQLISTNGYPTETHSVVTEDGYIVNLFRIPQKGQPVLLVHGIGDSSDSWLILGPPNSLAFLLYDVGFDVWVYNARGNKYSLRHTRSLPRKQYWNFSYEEMGSRDLPATIDYILLNSSRPKLDYVGFSQGTTIFFVMASMRPEYNKKINHAVLLAPVAWVSNLKYPFIDILTQNLRQLTIAASRLGIYNLFPNSPLLNLYHAQVCNKTNPARVLCDAEYYISYGLKDINNLPPSKIPVIASHIPAGTSTKTFLHFMQGYASKNFQRYNYYSLEENDMVYGSSKPPVYNVSSVSAPISLFVSESDWYSQIEDVKILRRKLPNVMNCIVFNKTLEFTHLEFIYGSRVKTLVNDPVVSLLKFYNKQSF